MNYFEDEYIDSIEDPSIQNDADSQYSDNFKENSQNNDPKTDHDYTNLDLDDIIENIINKNDTVMQNLDENYKTKSVQNDEG